MKTRGAEEIAAEEQRIAAMAAAERDRLLEQTRREIELQVRLAKRELVEHAADLAVQLATERIKKNITPADQERLVDRYLQQVSEAPDRTSTVRRQDHTMSLRTSATRYARALLDVAVKESDPQKVEQDLASIVDAVTANDEARRILANPGLPPRDAAQHHGSHCEEDGRRAAGRQTRDAGGGPRAARDAAAAARRLSRARCSRTATS